jgi:hypothetical protein
MFLEPQSYLIQRNPFLSALKGKSHHLPVACCQTITVPPQQQTDRGNRRPFVTVHEGMIPDQTIQ